MNKQYGKSSISSLILIAILFSAAGFYYSQRHLQEEAATTAPANSNGRISPRRPVPDNLGHIWPPQVGEPFPDLFLYSNKGSHHLSDFRGKVILVEPVGMNCPACNAWNGANRIGGYQGTSPQQGLASIEELLPRYAGIELDNPDIVLVHLLLYDMNLQTPTPEDAHKWAQHFGWKDKDNVYVMVGEPLYINKVSYDMIPGFYLIDRNFILRSDATGHRPKHNLWKHLLPMIPVLIDQQPDIAATDNHKIKYKPEKPKQVMDVQSAYKAIPHDRTQYRADSSRLEKHEADYFEDLFSTVDTAVVERVQTLQWMMSDGIRGANTNNYNWILGKLNDNEIPEKAREAHTLIKMAIKEQQSYFNWWNNNPSTRLDSSHHLIQNSHRKLLKAYKLLIKAYPEESKTNKKAFFDHLCALDFI